MKIALLRFTLLCLICAGLQSYTITSAYAGPFDCVKAKKYASYSKLRTAYLKNPEKKTDEDWFRAYTFATIFDGYPKCFNKKDVAIMRDFLRVIDGVCAQNKNWGTICKLAPIRGGMTDWAYNGYK